MNEIIQLKITLLDTSPSIWRRVLVNKTATFTELHFTIQIAMGWENRHLYEFELDGQRISEPNEDFDMEWGSKALDASSLTLESMICNPNEMFTYEYDFGDSWEHQIVVERFFPLKAKTKFPVCIDGELNCPPEDCGGIGGFYGMLEILKDKSNQEHKEILEWLGRPYDANHFDLSTVNGKLSDIEKYIEDADN